MPNEVLIYSDIQTHTAANFIKDVNEIEAEGEGDLVVRIDSNGGDPQATYGMIAKYNEFEGNKLVKIDGRAYSSAFYFAAMCKDVEALNVSQVMAHRAAFPAWYEEFASQEEKDLLEAINKDLEKAFRAKIDIEKFEAIAGFTVKEMFSSDDRKTVFLTAKQAKEIKLVNKIVTITSKIKTEIKSNFSLIAARYSEEEVTATPPKKIKSNNNHNNSITMTNAEFKAEHQEVYAAAVAEGVTTERERVKAALVFVDADAKAVTEIIIEGKEVTPSLMAELALKTVQKGVLAGLEKDSQDDLNTEGDAAHIAAEAEKARILAEGGKPALTAKEKNLAEAKSEMFVELGIKEKTV